MQNRIFASIIAIGLCAVLLIACGGSKNNNDTKAADSLEKQPLVVGTPERALDSLVTIAAPTDAKIMTALYNDYDAKTKTANWLCSNFDKLAKFKASGYRKFTSHLLFADSVAVHGTKQLYVIISSRPDGDDYVCHVCAPIEEVFIFAKQEPKWRLTYRKVFDQVGAYGESPSFELKKVGQDSYAFLIAPSDMAEGITSQGIALYSYYQAEFKTILTIPDVAGDNNGECDDKVAGSCWSYNYTLTFGGKPVSYDDIVLTKKGTQSKDGKVMAIDTTIKYQFAGSTYSAIK